VYWIHLVQDRIPLLRFCEHGIGH